MPALPFLRRGNRASCTRTASRKSDVRRRRQLRSERLEPRFALAAIPSATVNGPAVSSLIGEEIPLVVTFDNTATDPADIGYSPFVDIVMPKTGDAPPAPDNGISFKPGSATYNGLSLQTTVLTFDSSGEATHPFAKDAGGQPLVVTGTPGDQLVVVQLPFGSYGPEQPAADIHFTGVISPDAQPNHSYAVTATGGFRYQTDASGNPTVDVADLGTTTTDPIQPQLFRISKTSNTPEHETATGPNFQHTYTVSMAVAPGQTVTDLLLEDVLPGAVQFVAVSSVSGNGSTAITDVSTPNPSTPGGTLSRQFDRVVGTGSDSDVLMSFTYYVAQKDTGNTEVLPLDSGGTTVITNAAQASGKWTSTNPNFPDEQTITSDPDDANARYAFTARTVALQKSFTNLTNPGSARAGDTIEYTLRFQVSDFFALGDLAISDVLSDGQAYDLTFTPTISFTQQADSISGSFAPANVTTTDEPNGKQTVDFDVAAQLAALGLPSGSNVLGAAIPAGGTGGAEPSPTPAGPGTTGTIVFRAKVLNTYRVTPRPGAAVVQGDKMTDVANLTSEVLAYANLAPTGETVGDGSSKSFTLVSGNATKTLYAINGVTPTAGQRVTAGDDVTFRLTYTVPFSRIKDYKITDFLPLPVFAAQDLTFAVGGPSATAPAAGQWSFGPTDTFSQSPINGPSPTNPTYPLTVTSDSAANSITWNFGTFADPADSSGTTDILFTISASNKPFGDGLLLTNQAQQSERNETDDLITSNTAITQVTMSEPLLGITKGVVSTNNASGVFTPTPVAPAGVTFSPPGVAGASFTGTINSNGLAATPIDATLSNVAGNDLVKFSIIVENTGSGANGAFDVSIKDTLPAGFQIPTGGAGLNLKVTDGTGRSLPYTGNLFGTGIELIDTNTYPGPGINVEWFNQGSDLVGVWSGSLDPTIPQYRNDGPYTLSTTETFANTLGTAQFFHLDSAGSGNGQINAYRWSDQTYSSSAIGSGWFAFPARTSTATGDALRVEGRNNSPVPADLGVPVGYQANAPLAGTIVIPGESISSVFGSNLAAPREMFNDGTNTLTFQALDPATITHGALAASNPTNGKNVAVITYDLQLAPNLIPLEVITNTATLTNYASTEGGPNYLPPAGLTDDTTVTIQSPAVSKTLVGTSIVDTWNSNTQAVIGELVTYDLRVEVPQGTTPAAVLTDTFTDALGFVRVVGTPTVDPGVTVAGLANINSPTLTQNGTVAEWQLGDIVNSNTDDQLHGITFRIEAVVLNSRQVPRPISGPANQVELAWTGHTLPAVKADPVHVIEPRVTVTKTASQATAQAADTITYTIVVTASQTTAHNVSLADIFPGGITYVPGSLAHTAGIAPTTLATAAGGNSFTATYTALTPGQTSTLTFRATLDPTVTAGQTIANTVTETWTSLPGNPGQITPNSPYAYQRTGSGSTAQGQINNYATSSSATVTVEKPTVAKSLVTTSIVNASNSTTQAVIGETATYTVTMTIPQGRTPAAQLIDALGLGMAYVRTVSVVNDDPTKLTVPGLLSAPVLSNQGRTATWNLGDIVNTDTDSSTAETITFTIETVVLNVNTNTSGEWLVNKAQAGWDYTQFTPVVESDPVTVIEPKLRTTKAVSVGGFGGNAGDPVTYTIVVRQSGSSDTDAFNVTLRDVIPASIASPALTSVVDTAGIVTSANFALTGNTLTTTGTGFDLPKEPTTRTITLTVTGTLAGPVTANQRITNTNQIKWTSLPGDPGQITPNNPNAYERTGSGSTSLGQLNNYVTTGSASFTVNTADLAVVKTVNDPTPNVGDTITFTVTLSNLGPDTANEVEVTDQFPTAGLQLLTAVPSQGTYDQATGIWDVGTVLTGAGNAETLTITALVLAPAVNTIPLAQTNVATVTNSAEPDPNPGNNTGSATETPQYADLGVKKTTNNVQPGVGDTVVYTVSLFNLGTSDATNVELTDTLPTNVSFVSAAPSAGTFDPATGIWSISTVPTTAGVNNPLTLTITVEATATGRSFNTVTITASDQWDPNNRNNTAKTPTDPQEADLVVTKTVDDSTPNVGDDVTFTVTLSNLGPNAAQNVTVNDLLPAGLQYVNHTASNGNASYVPGTGEWTIGTMSSGSTDTLTVVATVLTPASGAALPQTNTATATSTTPDPNPDNNTDDKTVTPQQADLAVFKAVSDSAPNVGDTIVFGVAVANYGPDTATSVVVNDLLPAGVTYFSHTIQDAPVGSTYVPGTGVWTIGTVTTNDFPILQIVATVDAPSSGIPSAVTNTATVSGHEYDPDPSNNTDTATETPQYADLVIDKVVSDATPNVGDTIKFTITLTNLGADTATNVTVLDQLPAGLQFVSANANEGTYDPGTGIWTVGTVDTLFARTLQIDAVVLPPVSGVPQPATNTASVRTSNQYDPDPSNNTDSVTETPQYADLAVEKVVSNPRPNVGGQVTFTVTVTNLGVDAATGVTIADLLPTGLTFVSASPSAGTNYTAATGIWQIGTLPAGGVETLDIVVAVPSPGSFTNVAAVSTSNQYDPDPDNNTDRSTITTREADLAVTKSVSDPTPNVGDTITFTVTVSNLGADSANNVEITDYFPGSGLQIVGTPVASQGTYDVTTGVWTVGTVLVGGGNAQTLTIQARVLAPPINTIPPARTNVATVTKADEHDPNPGNNTGTATETPQYADLGVKKTTSNVQPNVGETVTYTVSLFNLGTAAATNVEVTDALPANVTFLTATPAAGTRFDETATGGIWSVPSIAPGQTLVLTLAVEATNTSVAFNTVTITHSDVWDPNNRNNTARTPTDPQEADVILSKTVNDATPNVRDTLTYTITVDNAGPSIAQSVVVTDVIPVGLTYVPGSASNGGSYDAGTRTVTWSLGNLPVGSVPLTVQTTVDEPSSGPVSPLENTASAISPTTDPNPDNNTDTSTVVPRSADLAVTKTVDKSEPSIGETVTFEIVVANYGPDTATSVVVNDLLPSGLQFVSASATQGAYEAGTGVWTVGTVTTAVTQTLTVAAKVVRTTGGTETNTATVSGREYEPNPSNNTASVAVEVQSSGVIVGTDIGCITGPFVRVIDPDTGADRIIPFFAYEPSFRGGVRVYGADVTGDGIPEILTAPGPGRPGEVKVFSETGTPLPEYSFFPFGPRYRGGIEISAGSITAAGEIQIVTAQSRGGTVRVFDVTPGSVSPVDAGPIREWKPFGKRYRGGVFVDTADLGTFNGSTRTDVSPDGITEVVVGSGPGRRATVNVYNAVANPPLLINSFNPFASNYKRGASVARLPSSIEGAADRILVSSGTRGGSLVETYSGLDQSRQAAFAAYAGSRASVFSAAISDTQIFGVEGEFGRTDGVRKFRSTSGLAGATLPQSTVAYPPLRVAILRR